MAKATKKRSRRGFGGGKKISLAVIAGLVPGIRYAAEAAQAGNWQGAGERVMLSYVGLKLNPFTFTTGYLGQGLYPLAMGFIAHAMATRFGLNRLLTRIVGRLPVEI